MLYPRFSRSCVVWGVSLGLLLLLAGRDTKAAPADLATAPARLAQAQARTELAQAVVPVEPNRRVVHTEVEPNRNYMATIAWSAIMGGVLGAAVGTAVYYLDSGERARNILYWAAGGVILGAGVGVVQVVVQENRASAAVSSTAPTDPARTLRLSLYRVAF